MSEIDNLIRNSRAKKTRIAAKRAKLLEELNNLEDKEQSLDLLIEGLSIVKSTNSLPPIPSTMPDVPSPDEVRQLPDLETYCTKINNDIDSYLDIWVAKDGVVYTISEMSSFHLGNVIKTAAYLLEPFKMAYLLACKDGDPQLVWGFKCYGWLFNSRGFVKYSLTESIVSDPVFAKLYKYVLSRCQTD